MKKKKFKIFISLVCVCGMVFACFGDVNYTDSLFTDIERTNNNEYLASVLDLELDVDNGFESEILSGETMEKEIIAINSGSLPFYYYILVDFYETNNLLCDSLNIALNLNGINIYNGLLINFDSTNIYLANNMSDSLDFRLSLPSGAGFFSDTCEFDFLFTAQQGEFIGTNLGFDDKEIVLNSVIGGGQPIVLNEVLPNPEGLDSRAGLLGEWVEIYNNSNLAVDLAGWYIEDGSTTGNRQSISESHTLFNSTVIGPKGSGSEWMVVFMINSVLNNMGDTVSLYDNEDNLIDEYTYAGSVYDSDSDSDNTPGGSNTGMTGDEAAGNEGKSYARIPDGIGEWIDPIPTPGGINDIDEYNEGEINEMILDSKSSSSFSAPAEEEPAEEEPAEEEPAEEPPFAKATEGEGTSITPNIVEEEPTEEEPIEEAPVEEEPVEEEPAPEESEPEPVVTETNTETNE